LEGFYLFNTQDLIEWCFNLSSPKPQG